MARTLNFNSVRKPTLDLIMKDANQTKIRVTVPTQSLIEQLQALVEDLQDIVNDKSSNSIGVVYSLSAKLMSCNVDGLNITSEELYEKYKLELEDLIIFFSAYLDFINDITNAKN